MMVKNTNFTQLHVFFSADMHDYFLNACSSLPCRLIFQTSSERHAKANFLLKIFHRKSLSAE